MVYSRPSSRHLVYLPSGFLFFTPFPSVHDAVNQATWDVRYIKYQASRENYYNALFLYANKAINSDGINFGFRKIRRRKIRGFVARSSVRVIGIYIRTLVFHKRVIASLLASILLRDVTIRPPLISFYYSRIYR